jgi:hypothetical protein
MNSFILRTIGLAILAYSLCAPLTAQEPDVTRNGVGMGLGISKVIGETGTAPGVILCYSRSFSAESAFAVVTGLEMILDEHRHTTLGLGLEYSVWRGLGVCASLGLSYLPGEGFEPGVHFEAAYGFDIGKISLGPMIEYGIGIDEMHLLFGLQAAFGF